MSRRMMCSIVAILALALLVSGVYAAEDLPEGVTMVVLKDEPAPHLEGIARVRLMELRMAPGAKWPHDAPYSGFCTMIQGTFTNVSDKKTTTRFVGDSWSMKKRTSIKTAHNYGNTESVMRMWIFIDDDKSM